MKKIIQIPVQMIEPIESGGSMTREEELDWLYRLRSEIYVHMPKEWLIPMNNALDMAINALELLDTLTERPCDVCEHHKEKGCCKWNCVFDGMIGDK